jgi:hypothetical protein
VTKRIDKFAREREALPQPLDDALLGEMIDPPLSTGDSNLRSARSASITDRQQQSPHSLSNRRGGPRGLTPEAHAVQR